MRTAAALAACLLASSAAFAAQAGSNRNAATWYGRAFESLAGFSEADEQLVRAYIDDPSNPPSAQLRDVLSRMDGAMELTRRGGGLPHADFGLDYDQGFDLLLPHLAPSRQLSRLLQADTLARLHAGDTIGAVGRMNTMIELSRHLTSDRTMIGSLVAQSIWKMSDSALEQAFDRGSVTQDGAATLLRALNGLDQSDPFGLVESLSIEQDVAIVMAEREFEASGNLEGLVWTDGEAPDGLDDLTPDGLDEAIDSYSAIMDRSAEIFMTADREEGLEALSALADEIEAGEHGPLAAMLVPNWSNIFKQLQNSREELAARRATLEAIASDAVAPKEQANAALWYVRAAERLAARGPDALIALQRCAARAQPLDEKLAAVLDDADDVWSLLDEAAEIPRCDFAFARGDLETAPSYAPLLRDLLRLVTVDVQRRHAEGGEILGRRLVVGWAMLGHFATDSAYPTAIMTHAAFTMLAPMTAAAAERLPAERRGDLWARANRLHRTDPFGYVGAAVRTRAALATRLGVDASKLDAARLYDLTVIGDALLQPRDATAWALESTRLASLWDVIDVQRVERLRFRAPIVTMEEGGVSTAIDDIAWEDAGRLAERTRRARADFRVGLRSLRPLRPQAMAPAVKEKAP